MVLSEVFRELALRYQIIITLPNADTASEGLRSAFIDLEKELKGKVKCIENFGTLAYFSVMKHSSILLGNTSSGIIEAASFGKRVIDVGDRQKGRLRASNVVNVPVDRKAILNAVNALEVQGPFDGKNPYFQGGAVNKIIKVIKAY
jgi:GDP/UDP-N,N'-diacetylbacillosamine 2-epimerase (hydrolysing)